ncbi:hypothetical protein ACS0TY_031572 [Phlomoides rotata]
MQVEGFLSDNGTVNQTSDFNTMSKGYLDQQESSTAVKALVSRLTGEKRSAIQQNNKLKQELKLLWRRIKNIIKSKGELVWKSFNGYGNKNKIRSMILFPLLNKEFCPSVKNILLLDSEGMRVASKYYSDDWPTNTAKEAFEKTVFSKTHKTNARAEAEFAMLENNIIVYKFVQDLHFYVTGGEDENELILASVLQGFFDAVDILLRGNVDKREALENLDVILLCIDEIVDGGIILETDSNTIASKVAGHSVDSGAPLSEQTISQALATAREHLTRSLLK